MVNFMVYEVYLNTAVIKKLLSKTNIVAINVFEMQGDLSFHRGGIDFVIITGTFCKILGALSSSTVCSFRHLHFEVLQIKHVFRKETKTSC